MYCHSYNSYYSSIPSWEEAKSMQFTIPREEYTLILTPRDSYVTKQFNAPAKIWFSNIIGSFQWAVLDMNGEYTFIRGADAFYPDRTPISRGNPMDIDEFEGPHILEIGCTYVPTNCFGIAHIQEYRPIYF